MKYHPRTLRAQLAQEAARLMFEEGVSQYFDAKRIAARRLQGTKEGRRTLRHRPHDLPSNGEIQTALRRLADQREGPDRQDRLFAMRLLALHLMESLPGFDPRLIGSVSTGFARQGSDIDLHVFTDQIQRLEQRLDILDWAYDTSQVCIRVSTSFQDYLHIHLRDQDFPVELSVYPWSQRRVTTRSSTDGKPIVRLKPAALRQRIAQDHPDAWRRWQDTGASPDIDALLSIEEPLTMADWEAQQRANHMI